MNQTLIFDFTARLEKETNGLASHFIVVPTEIASVLLNQKIRRTIGTMNNTSFNLALISDGQGERRLSVGNSLRKKAGLVEGSLVQVHIQPDPNPDQVELCEEFEAILDLDEEAGKVFYGFTPGLQRSLAHYANGAKQIETRVKRALNLAQRLKDGSLSVQTKKSRTD